MRTVGRQVHKLMQFLKMSVFHGSGLSQGVWLNSLSLGVCCRCCLSRYVRFRRNYFWSLSLAALSSLKDLEEKLRDTKWLFCSRCEGSRTVVTVRGRECVSFGYWCLSVPFCPRAANKSQVGGKALSHHVMAWRSESWTQTPSIGLWHPSSNLCHYWLRLRSLKTFS